MPRVSSSNNLHQHRHAEYPAINPRRQSGHAFQQRNVVSSAKVQGPLLNTRWNQDAPYNSRTPMVNGKHTYAGCASTAIAQLVNFHQWPVQGKGKVSYFWEDGGRNISVDFKQFQPDYSLCPSSLKTASGQEKSAVADLIYQIGVGLEAQFGLDKGSPAGGKLIDRLLYTHLMYGDSRRSAYSLTNPEGANLYTQTEWLNTIKNEIDAGRPVLYMAQNQKGDGHVFIIDGYQGNKVHVNWGWGGFGDGYYALDEMNPDPAMPEEKWIVSPTMYIGIKPRGK